MPPHRPRPEVSAPVLASNRYCSESLLPFLAGSCRRRCPSNLLACALPLSSASVSCSVRAAEGRANRLVSFLARPIKLLRLLPEGGSISFAPTRACAHPSSLFKMGIEGLWKLVEAASERHSLRTLAVREGFEGPRPSRLYTIGVDVSIWIRQLQQTFAVGHAQSGENPELRTFYYRLAMLYERPLHIIFVDDGPARPAVKRMRRLVDAFGFAWFDAAGEAEAELALMNELGVIDAVMTDDSDVLLFGAQVIIRNPSFKRSAADEIVLTRASAVRDLGYTRGDLLLYALLVGSDYDQVGY
ncbi:hypothetical protein NUW54_g8761 [Trametes sanguinea]|uniref:Uncharacterized protein n=1 Tax=Trametes sanguinea TaxID=158606 RepID=A0ACC1PB03_9APHY|nr:hypothetical protein NUW54_g8761 [Trametes sanguinea]